MGAFSQEFAADFDVLQTFPQIGADTSVNFTVASPVLSANALIGGHSFVNWSVQGDLAIARDISTRVELRIVAAGEMRRVAAATATAPILFTGVATPQGWATLSGEGQINWSSSPLIEGAATLRGSEAITFSSIPLLDGLALLQAASSIDWTATIRTVFQMSGSADVVFLPTADIWALYNIAASTTIFIGPLNVLKATFDLDGEFGASFELRGAFNETFTGTFDEVENALRGTFDHDNDLTGTF